MTNGGQPITSKRLGLAFETAGARAASPTAYIIAGGKVTFQPEKKNNEIQVSGNRDPAMTYRGVETCKISIPMMALVDHNGLGDLLLGTFGTDTPAQCGSTAAWDHVFTANDTAKTMTIWAWDTLKPKSARMCAVDSMKFDVDRDKNEVIFTFDLVGADVVDSATFGSPSVGADPGYISAATEKPNLIPAGQAILEYGEPLAAVRNSWKKISISSKENIKFGPGGKGAPVPAGSTTPKMLVKGKRATSISIDLIDTDGVEQMRCREGGDTTPTATAEADNADLVRFRLKLFGSSIAAGLNAYADLNNTASVGVANLAVYSTAQNSNKDITFTAKTPGVIPTITYAEGTSLAVAVDGVNITVTLDDSPAPTADDIIAAIQASTTASALVTVARKAGQTGVGTPSAFTVQPLVAAATGTDVTVSGSYTGSDVAMIKVWIDASDTPDTFSWQLNDGTVTTGVACATEATALGTTGISVAFTSATGGVVGDTFYVFTHWQRVISFTSLTNALEAWKDKGDGDFYEGTVSMVHVSGPSETKPSMTLRTERTTAYA